MARSISLIKGLAVAATASLVLAACGDDGDDEEADEQRPGEEEEVEAGNNQYEFVEALFGEVDEEPPGCEDDDDPPEVESDGKLVVGSLLPETGSLAILGPPEFAGVDLAIEEINEGGGVLDEEVEVHHGDSGDAQNPIASATVDDLFSNNVDVIVGAASSGVSLSVIDKITGAGVLHFSPANTSPELSNYCDKGLYFRTAPSDTIQGRVLADLVAADGAQNVAILALQDSYGTGLADEAEKNLTSAGVSVPEKIIYDPKAPNFASEVTKAKGANPDAVILIGFDETIKMVPELIKQGLGPQDLPLYFVDGNLADYSEDMEPGALDENVKGTLPGADAPDEFRDRLLEINPDLKDFSYAGESYDATLLTALAAIAAESDSPTDIAAELVGVSRDDGGDEECTGFAACKELLEEGVGIDYQGVSGPIDFFDNGDISAGFIGIYQYK